MTYFVDVFSLDTFESFSNTPKNTAGFHPNRKAWVTKIKPGDKILCYLKGLSCWVGILEVTGSMAEAAPSNEILGEYILRFPVKPLVWLKRGALLSIKRADVWAALSFTKDVTLGAGGWNAIVRSSGVRLQEPDGQKVEELLSHQAQHPTPDDIADETWEKHRSLKMTNALGKVVAVQIPVAEQEVDASQSEALTPTPCDTIGPANVPPQVRTSHKMQALLADIGIAMGFEVWIPKADKEAVLSEMSSHELLAALPYTQFSGPALKAVEQIDVLWLQKKTIVRAFEVEHTTAVYSGILRMADLLALQPNFHTKLHIVAPEERRKKVFQELMRPAFSIFPQGPLSAPAGVLNFPAGAIVSALQLPTI
jgi:hypothetical protein